MTAEEFDEIITKLNGDDCVYGVDVFVTTFEMDFSKTPPYHNVEIFSEGLISERKKKAYEYYNKMLEETFKAEWPLPLHGPENFIRGKHAAASVDIFFVEIQGTIKEYFYLETNDPDEVEESKIKEQQILAGEI